MLPENFRKTVDVICDHLKLPRGVTTFSFFRDSWDDPFNGVRWKAFWTTLTLVYPTGTQRLISLDPTELDALETALKEK